MAFNLGTAVGYLMLDTSGFEKGFKTASTQLKTFFDSSQSLNTRLNGLSSGLTSIGANLTKNITLPLVGLGTFAGKSAIEFESAFTGVRKTVDATEEEFAQLEKGIKDMSNRMPQSASAIAEVMEIAGQLGIRGTENLLSFTDTMIRLGDSTNLSSEEAATAIARIMNVMGTATEDVGRFGSTIVDLGNNFATTESEITEMANRLASGGKLAGLTEPQILALATAMSSVGINAEAGGTAMTQTFNAIEKAVANGGDKLESFAEISSMTAEDFVKAWEKDPITAIQSFIEGLGDLESNGGSAVLALDELGLSGIRQSDMLKSLSQAGDLLNDTLETANTAWSENVALTNESETRYGTLASKLQILWNNVKNLAISFGNLLMPAIEKVSSFIQSIVEKINSLNESQKRAIGYIAGLAAVIGPVLIIVGKIVGVFSKLIGLFTGAISPVGIIIGLIAALVAAFVYFWNTSEKFRQFWIDLWESIKQVVSNAIDIIIDIWNVLSDFFATAWSAIYESLQPAIEAVINAFEAAWSLIQTVWSALKPFFESLVQGIIDIWNGIVPVFVLIWDQIKIAAETAWNIIVDVFSAAWDLIKAVWSVAVSFFSTLWNTVAGIFSAVEAVLSGDFKGAWEAIKGIFSTWGDFFKGLWEQLVTVFSGAVNLGKKIVDDIKQGISNAWESLVSWFKGLWDSLFGNLNANVNVGTVSGSAATGLDYVSKDGLWQLHEGERVLSKEENAEYSNGNNRSSGDVYNFYSPKALSPTSAARAMQKAKRQLAAGVY